MLQKNIAFLLFCYCGSVFSVASNDIELLQNPLNAIDAAITAVSTAVNLKASLEASKANNATLPYKMLKLPSVIEVNCRFIKIYTTGNNSVFEGCYNYNY
jgi:hypothetical protein